MAIYIHLEEVMEKTRRINHIFLLVIIALLEYIVFSSHLSGISGIVAFCACPIFCTVLYTLKSKQQIAVYMVFALFCSLLSYCFVFDIKLVDNIINFLFTFMQIHLCAFVLSNCLKSRNNSFKNAIFALTGANLFIAIANIAVIRYYHNIDIIDVLNTYFKQVADESVAIIKSYGIIEGVTQQQIIDVFDLVCNAIISLIPAALIIICFVISFVTYEITAIMFKAYIKNRTNDQKFRFVSVPNSLSIAAVLLLLVSLISDSLYLGSVIYNFVLVAAFLYISQGYAVICFYIYKKIKSDALAIIISVTVLMITIISCALIPSINGFSVLFFVGLFDSNFDFRKISNRKKLF